MELIPHGQEWALHRGDVIAHMHAMPAGSVDLVVTSVPFPSLFSYTSEACDLGNSEDLKGETKLHFGFFFRALVRVVKPGRAVMIHCMQIPRMARSGGKGLFDFRGFLIRLGQRAGLVYEYDWLIRKNPQAQAIRTKSRSLQFAGLESDRAKSRGTLGDYVIKFSAPGDNDKPVVSEGEVSRNDWIQFAECCWSDIAETNTLNVKGTKGEEDTRHVCPLQLGVIERLVKLYSDPGEIVFDPFTGIGSTGYVSLKLGRRFYGAEIKPEYQEATEANLAKAIRIREADEKSQLFDFAK